MYLSELLEVNSLNNPPVLPGSFLPRAGRGNEPGDEVTQTQLEVEKLFGDFFSMILVHGYKACPTRPLPATPAI